MKTVNPLTLVSLKTIGLLPIKGIIPTICFFVFCHAVCSDKLKILQYPDSRLLIRAEPVRVFDHQLKTLTDQMFEVMYASGGIGLAGTQVGIAQRIVVMDVSHQRNFPRVFINPEITVLSDEMSAFPQGCLSVPNLYDWIVRPAKVRIDAMDLKGKAFSLEDDGIIAVCIQHEIDHLNGKLIIHHLPNEKRQAYENKWFPEKKDQKRSPL